LVGVIGTDFLRYQTDFKSSQRNRIDHPFRPAGDLVH
jgi:hypothetical protein